MLRMLLTVALGAILLAGCQVSEEPESYDVAHLALPQGHPQTGRQVFIRKGCAACHRVEWETELPEPTQAVTGPDFEARHSFLSTGYLATSITSPSYHVREPYAGQVAGELSPMADYTASITVRELVDIVAYLKSQGDDDRIAPPDWEMLPHAL